VPIDLAAVAERALTPALGPVRVTLGDRLPSGDRNVVQRAVAHDGAGRRHFVVLKRPAGAGLEFAREQAALRLLADHDVPQVVRLLGANSDPPLLVLADVGDGPTLADRLLGNDAPSAERAVHAWAVALATLQAGTQLLRSAFADELAAASPLGALPVEMTGETLADAATAVARLLPRLGLTPPARALDELRGAADELTVASPADAGGLSPGDTCPSNAVESDGRLVLLDFEGAEHRHVAWDAAYLTVPWSTCWCAWRLPPELTPAALDTWRQTLGQPVPHVLTAAFDDELTRATLAWTWWSVGALLARTIDDDPPASTRHARCPNSARCLGTGCVPWPVCRGTRCRRCATWPTRPHGPPPRPGGSPTCPWHPPSVDRLTRRSLGPADAQYWALVSSRRDLRGNPSRR